MSFAPKQENRRLLPRWRPFREAVASGELGAVRKLAPSSKPHPGETFLTEKREEWQREPSIGLAVDILGSAVVMGRASEFEAVGWWLLTKTEEFAPSVVELANACVASSTGSDPGQRMRHPEPARLLHSLRLKAQDDPRDAVLHTDLALLHATLGNLAHAKRSMLVAQSLAPTNRFVLRSASRFWVHAGEPDRAHTILRRSDRTRHDPWLLAAELATSSIANKSPRFVGDARVFLHNRSTDPHHLSELAGALGTLEAINGKRSSSRNHFAQSLIAPTENAVAQAVWAQETVRVLRDIELDRFSYLHPHEAAAWQARIALDWTAVINHCRSWLDDEPYSVVPATFGSFIASLAGNYAETREFAQRGLKANPSDFMLKNNFLVARAFLNEKIEDADLHQLVLLSRSAATNSERATFLATSGLILIMANERENGRELYERAIEIALAAGDRRTAAMAAAFWIRAEHLCPDGASSRPLEIFNQQARTLRDPEIIFLKRQLEAPRPL